jgi:hypothetical protein
VCNSQRSTVDAAAALACAPSMGDRRRRRSRNCSTVAMTNGSEASPAAPKTTKDTLGTPIDPKKHQRRWIQ